MSNTVNPENALHQQVVEALNAGQPRQAIALLEPICKSGKADPQQWYMLGAALGISGDAASAELAFRETLRMAPRHLEALANLGRALAEQGKYDEAANTLQQVLAIKPDHHQARIGLITALTQLQRYPEAKTLCDELLNGNPNHSEVLILLGNIHKAKGELNAAIACFDRVLGVDPKSVPALMNKGLALKTMNKGKDAIACFIRAGQLAPNNSNIWFIKGVTHVGLGEMEMAAADLETTFRLNPQHITAGSHLAKVYRYMKRFPESVEISKRVLAVDPDNAQAKFYIEAIGNQEQERGQKVQRIPREVAEATYSEADVGKLFEASLKGGLEYKAPDVLDAAVRKVCGQRQSGMDILEVGCGTGLCGSRFADLARTLVGTDLSSSMLDVAREKNVYTDLYVADLIDVLSDNLGKFDLIIAMDVLCYFGDLSGIFHKCHETLRSGGVFAFSVEKPDDDELWLLHHYGHFVHSLRHIRQVAEAAGFDEEFVEEMALRRELQEQRMGYVCLYRRK